MIPQTFTLTSEHIRFYFSVFLFLHFLVVVSVRQIKLTHVGFRAHVKISSRIVSCRKNFRTLLQLASISQYSTLSGHMRIVDTARTACGAESMQRSCVRPSVRPSVPPIDSNSGVRRVCCWAPCGQGISIDSGGSRRPGGPAATAQQHGVQQQMRAVSCWQPRDEAEHIIIIIIIIIILYYANRQQNSNIQYKHTQWKAQNTQNIIQKWT